MSERSTSELRRAPRAVCNHSHASPKVRVICGLQQTEAQLNALAGEGAEGLRADVPRNQSQRLCTCNDKHTHHNMERRKEGNVLFNDTLNTLRLYGVRHMVKDHLDSERKPGAAIWATLSD